MAWQLIYTSASRLLEAGLTGFGTVARHRAIPPLVVKAVERISQFARLPGYDQARIIFSHRILTVGGSRFHVLSRLRDAGSDYSGRTNHIAHHVIAPASEIAQIAPGAVTPADVLMQMTWLDRWDRTPEWLESSEEIPLTNFSTAPDAERAWETVTGNAEHRWLLVNGPASKGCCLITPSHARLLPLLTASQHCQTSAQSWQTGFTTALQPTDDLGDYRWMGVPADAPLRTILESSGRPVLDLTSTATLPEPEIPRSTSSSPARVARASSPPTPTAGKYTPPPPPHTLSGINNPPSVSDGRKHIPFGRRRKEAKAPRSWLPALVAIVVIAGGAAAYFLSRKQSPAPANSVPMASHELENQIKIAENAAGIRKIVVSGSDAASELGKFIKMIQGFQPPATFEQAVSALGELDPEQRLMNNPQIGLPHVQPVFQKLEEEAWQLCEKAKPDKRALENYNWTYSEAIKKADFVKKWLNQPTSVNAAEFPGGHPPAWMMEEGTPPSPATSQTPSALPASNNAAAPAAQPQPNPEAAHRPARITILKAWDSLEDFELGAEWTDKLMVCLPGGSFLTLDRDRMTGAFREGVKDKRFQLTGRRLKKEGDQNYDYLDLFNNNNSSVWRLSTTERPVVSKPKASAALKWDEVSKVFELADEEWQKLQIYQLADGQAWILECPFTVKEAKAAEAQRLLFKGQKTISLKSWIDKLEEAANAKPDGEPEYEDLAKRIKKAQNDCAFKIENVRPARGKADVARFDKDKQDAAEEFDSTIKQLEDERASIVGRINDLKKKAEGHALRKHLEQKKLPPGRYSILLKRGRDDAELICASEFTAE